MRRSPYGHKRACKRPVYRHLIRVGSVVDAAILGHPVPRPCAGSLTMRMQTHVQDTACCVNGQHLPVPPLPSKPPDVASPLR
eukprot:6361181-Amphidinium_carterae.3